MNPSQTPTTKNLTFFQALEAVTLGARITKIEWQDETCYGLLRAGRLALHKSDGFHDWIISDGDLQGTDWIVLPEAVSH